MQLIKVIGLGSGELAQLPLGIYEEIKACKELFVRTEKHPAIQELRERGISIRSFDFVYEKHNEEFELVYPEIVRDLIEKAKESEIVYAVPGHPMVAEKSVQLLLESDYPVEILGGKSFIDDLFQSVKVDPSEGFQLLDAFDLHHDQINAGQHVIIMQVFSPFIASEVKLTLMEKYADDQTVCIVDAAGTSDQKVEWKKLYELDHFDGVHNLRSVYIPPVERDKRTTAFDTLQYYVDEITSESGDIWIQEQTFESLLPYLKEEVGELLEAFDKEDIENVIEELGDVLLLVLYLTNLGEKMGEFSLEEVLHTINSKLRRRHPHVFDGVEVQSIEEVNQLWEEIKRQEKGE